MLPLLFFALQAADLPPTQAGSDNLSELMAEEQRNYLALKAEIAKAEQEEKDLAAKSRWFFIDASRDPASYSLIYGDRQTAVAVPEGVLMWTDMRIMHANGANGGHFLTRYRYDCQNGRARMEAVTLVSGKGDRSSQSDEVGEWQAARPGTVSEAELWFACGRLAGTPLGDLTPEQDAGKRLRSIRSGS